MVMEKIDRKRRDKKLCLWIGLWIIVFVDWTLDNCVCFRELIIISAKNNEKATFIINIQPPKVYAKSGVFFFFTEIQFNVNDFLETSGEDYNC